MKKFIMLFMCLAMVFTISGCSSSDDIGENVDQAFVEYVQKGLEARWKKQTDDNNLNGSVSTVTDFKRISEYIKIEYDNIKVFSDKEFSDSELGGLAKTFILDLKKMLEDTSKEANEITGDVLSDYGIASNERNSIAYQLQQNYNLTISDEFKEIFDEMMVAGKLAYEKQNKNSTKSGTYEVGKDVEAGEYLILIDQEAKDAKYEVRTTEFKNSYEDVIISEDFIWNDYVTLYDGQFVELENCNLYPIDNAPAISYENRDCVCLKVGRDIEEGNYIVTASQKTFSTSYFKIEVEKDENSNKSHISNEFDFTGDKKISLLNGQYIRLENCTIKEAE